MNQNNTNKGIVIALIFLSFAIFLPMNNIASAIRDHTYESIQIQNQNQNQNLEFEISRFNDNFEKYLETISEKDSQ